LTDTQLNTWQDVRTEVLGRIHSRQWKPGEFIPREADLADEFGCARATVNRALRAVADAGLIERKRKAGTRVATTPVRTAKLRIPVIRHEIEDNNQTYSYRLISAKTLIPPANVRTNMGLRKKAKALKVVALHLADNTPYVFEQRWINTEAVPDILNIDLLIENANEWLVMNAPFSDGDIAFSAMQADDAIAETLGAKTNDALFVVDRTTWNGKIAITSVRMTFHSGYRMQTVV